MTIYEEKYGIFKFDYWQGASLVGKYLMPKLAPNQFIPQEVISFNERKSVSAPEKHWLDFFIDDYHYENFWKYLRNIIGGLRNFAGIISTDYSMLPEMLPGQRIWNCTRNRIIAYFLQKQGFNVIPVASWCSKEDFDWCFDGLPEDSSIAISSNGCLSSPYGRKTLLAGVEELQRQKSPFKIIVCGRPFDEFKKYDNVICYPSFSQRMQERINDGEQRKFSGRLKRS